MTHDINRCNLCSGFLFLRLRVILCCQVFSSKKVLIANELFTSQVLFRKLVKASPLGKTCMSDQTDKIILMKKQKKTFWWLAWCSILLFSFGFSNAMVAQTKSRADDTPKTNQIVQHNDDLYHRWELMEMDSDPVATLFPDKSPTIEFRKKEKQVIGFAGCNQYRGQLILDGDNVKIVGIVATKKACPELDQEEEFLAILQEIEQYTISGSELLLWSSGQVLLKFKRAE